MKERNDPCIYSTVSGQFKQLSPIDPWKIQVAPLRLEPMTSGAILQLH